jgi:hypothetical protein
MPPTYRTHTNLQADLRSIEFTAYLVLTDTFSRIFSGNMRSNNGSKDKSKAENRFDLTGTFALLQKQLLKVFPSLHNEAALRDVVK